MPITLRSSKPDMVLDPSFRDEGNQGVREPAQRGDAPPRRAGASPRGRRRWSLRRRLKGSADEGGAAYSGISSAVTTTPAVDWMVLAKSIASRSPTASLRRPAV